AGTQGDQDEVAVGDSDGVTSRRRRGKQPTPNDAGVGGGADGDADFEADLFHQAREAFRNQARLRMAGGDDRVVPSRAPLAVRSTGAPVTAAAAPSTAVSGTGSKRARNDQPTDAFSRRRSRVLDAERRAAGPAPTVGLAPGWTG